MTHHIPSEDWQSSLTAAIRMAKNGDTIIVPTYAIKGAATNAIPILRDGGGKLNITVTVETRAPQAV